MRFGNFILGLALLIVAATVAITTTFRNDSSGRSAVGTGERGTAAPRRSATLTAGSSPSRSSGLRPSHRARSGGEPRVSRPRVEDLGLAVKDGPESPADPGEIALLEARTGKVRAQALAKLDEMTTRFDLTRDQRLKIFPHLVQATSGYHPAMVVTGGATGSVVTNPDPLSERSPDEEIHDVLDPEQQEEFVEDAIDKRLWWAEIASQLEEDFDNAIAAATPEEVYSASPEDPEIEASPPPDEGDTPVQQGGNIFDLLNQ